jgi:methionyl-tRNA synthetase
MFRDAELREALSLVQAVGAEVNRTLAKEEPWRLPHEEGHRVLTRLLPALDVLGVASWPIVPQTASRIRRILGREIEPRGWSLEEGPPVIRDAPVPPLQL